MKQLTLSAAATLAVVTGLPAAAAAPDCSIHPPQGASHAELLKMTKFTKEEAEAEAQRLHPSDAARGYNDAKLETINDCLVWSVNIRDDNDPGVLKFHIDAGNGKVLGVAHQSASER